MKSLEELRKLREASQSQVDLRREATGMKIIVGMDNCGLLAGARSVTKGLLEESKKRNLTNIRILQTGCIGNCELEPIIEVFTADGKKTTYVEMTEEKAIRVVDQHIMNGREVREYMLESVEK